MPTQTYLQTFGLCEDFIFSVHFANASANDLTLIKRISLVTLLYLLINYIYFASLTEVE